MTPNICEDILVYTNQCDWAHSRAGTWFCNVWPECSFLNRKSCWALGSIYCLTHDNKAHWWIWDLELGTFTWYVSDVTSVVICSFFSLVFFHCSGDRISHALGCVGCYQPLSGGQDFYCHGVKLQDAVSKNMFQKHKVILIFKAWLALNRRLGTMTSRITSNLNYFMLHNFSATCPKSGSSSVQLILSSTYMSDETEFLVAGLTLTTNLFVLIKSLVFSITSDVWSSL